MMSKNRASIWTVAALTAFVGQPIGFRDASAQEAAVGVSGLARGTVSYSRPEDATATRRVVDHFGDGPFARNRAEAVQNVGLAIDQFSTNEGITLSPEQRAEIIRTIQGAPNLANFPITGVNPNFIAPREVADGQVGRRGGELVYEGVGAEVISVEMPRVPSNISATGSASVPAERYVTALTVPGRGDVYLVMTLSEDCQNWIFKLLPRPRVENAVSAAAASPCMDLTMTNLPPGTIVQSYEGSGVRRGEVLAAADAAIRALCINEGDRMYNNIISVNCIDCDSFRPNAESEVRANLPRGRELAVADERSFVTYRVGEDGVLRMRTPRQTGALSGDPSSEHRELCFKVPTGERDSRNRIVIGHVSNVFGIHDNDIRDINSDGIPDNGSGVGTANQDGITFSATDPRLREYLRWAGTEGEVEWTGTEWRRVRNRGSIRGQ